MKTLVYATHHKPPVYRDGYLPGQRPESEPHAEQAHFSAAHLQKFTRLNFTTFKSTPGQRHEPDQVWIGSNAFRFERGVCDKVRHGEQNALAEIAAVDAQLLMLAEKKQALLHTRQALLEDAYARGRKLRADEIKEARCICTPIHCEMECPACGGPSAKTSCKAGEASS